MYNERTKNNYDPWEALASAVVLQAVEDYRTCLEVPRHLWHEERAKNDKTRRTVEMEIAELERFFLGETIKLYTTVPGCEIVRRLRAEAKKKEGLNK